jgi:hypothetical protein
MDSQMPGGRPRYTKHRSVGNNHHDKEKAVIDEVLEDIVSGWPVFFLIHSCARHAKSGNSAI